MKKTAFIFLISFFSCITLFCQTTKQMTWNGKQREYIEYVPESYDAGTPAPVLFCLHGLGDEMTSAFNAFGFKKIADDHGWILITPQALNATTIIGSIGTAWDAGVSVDASMFGISGRIHVNQGVDDCGFLLAILDDLIANYSVDEGSVFVTGFSMGGFMTNRIAIEHGDRIKAVASVSGTIGYDIQESVPVTPINTMHIHGNADEVVSYADAALTYNSYKFVVGVGAEATVDYWRTANGCDEEPEHTIFDDIANDGLTFERYMYKNGENGTKTCFIKVNNGQHDWYYTPANDIDYTTEIYNFFVSCMNETSVGETEKQHAGIFPNPSDGIFHINAENVNHTDIYDITGKKIIRISDNTIDLTNYPSGIYLIDILFNNGKRICEKVIVR